MGLSVVIVALNEEANIARTLESVRWADEIVLVDSGSIDRTREIAQQYGAKVVVEPWRGHVGQKNYALELCTQTWVLALDADEQVSPDLAKEIRSALADPKALNGYWMPRRNLFLGRWIRYGGFYPDPKLRLFRRGDGYSTGHDPHDHYDLKNCRAVGRFKNPLIHYAYPTLSYYLEHMNSYSSLCAKLALAKGHSGFSLPNIIVRPMLTFMYNYFIRLGFLDGREGLLLHLYHSVYVSWKYAKAWELARKPEADVSSNTSTTGV
jgi:glycosyltransferase involved in cell wall biosynthesis